MLYQWQCAILKHRSWPWSHALWHMHFSVVATQEARPWGNFRGLNPPLASTAPMGFVQNWWEMFGYPQNILIGSTEFLIAVKLYKIWTSYITYFLCATPLVSHTLEGLTCPSLDPNPITPFHYIVFRKKSGTLELCKCRPIFKILSLKILEETRYVLVLRFPRYLNYENLSNFSVNNFSRVDGTTNQSATQLHTDLNAFCVCMTSITDCTRVRLVHNI